MEDLAQAVIMTAAIPGAIVGLLASIRSGLLTTIMGIIVGAIGGMLGGFGLPAAIMAAGLTLPEGPFPIVGCAALGALLLLFLTAGNRPLGQA